MMNTRQIPTRTTSPDPVITPTTATPEAEQRLIEFCERQIEKMSKYSNLLNSNNLVGFDELVRAQAEYQSINLSLISLNVLAKTEYTKTKEAFEDWYADKYVSMRDELNPRTLSAQKWLSQKEIELHIRVRYKNEYKSYLLEMEYAEQKVALMRRLMESWERHSFTLGQISANIRAEIRGSYTED